MTSGSSGAAFDPDGAFGQGFDFMSLLDFLVLGLPAFDMKLLLIVVIVVPLNLLAFIWFNGIDPDSRVQTATQYIQVMDKLRAVITDTGSIAGHFSSVAREFGVPALLNTNVATSSLTTGQDVTVHADGKIVFDVDPQ